MANPQLEDGRIEIANEIGEALSRTYFSPAESKVLWAILRKTYGWHKKIDKISYSQFEEATGLHSRHIGPALKRLIKRNIIFCSNYGERKTSEYGIQKDYDKWQLTPIQVTDSVTDLSNKLTPIQVTDDKTNLLPITVKTTTGLSNKSVTDLSKHKSNNTYTKASTGNDDFQQYLERKVTEFPLLDVSQEWKDCQDWYAEKGQKIKIPKSALNNWLKIALVKKMKSGGIVSNGTKETRVGTKYVEE